MTSFFRFKSYLASNILIFKCFFSQQRQQQSFHSPQHHQPTSSSQATGSGNHYFGSSSIAAVMSPIAPEDESGGNDIELGGSGSGSSMAAGDGRGSFKSIPTSSTVV